jgi:hypothetical protein
MWGKTAEPPWYSIVLPSSRSVLQVAYVLHLFLPLVLAAKTSLILAGSSDFAFSAASAVRIVQS